MGSIDEEEPIVHSSYSGLKRKFGSLPWKDENAIPVLRDPLPDPLLHLKLYEITASGQNSSSPKQVMVELTGAPHTGDIGGYLDLVVVLDVSGSMQGEKLEKMKKAMGFVIDMLNENDRLAIIQFREKATFAHNIKTFLMVGKYQEELRKAVNCLEARGNTNITAGLQMALNLTRKPKFPGRVNGILLLSDGLQNEGGDARNLRIGDRQVDTFGFGEDHDPEVLNSIARNSLGGTFNYVRVRDGLVEPFSQPVGGLHHTVVRDLKLTVRQEKPNKQDQTKTEGKTQEGMVDAGGYKPEEGKESNDGSVTVNFGNLYCDEVRTVIVNLSSPLAAEETFHVKYSYRLPARAERFKGAQYSHAVWLPLSELPTKPDMPTELARRNHVKLIGDAINEADKKNLAGAKSKLLEAKNKLAEAKQEQEKAKEAQEQKEDRLKKAQEEAKKAQAREEAKLAQEISRFDFTKSEKMIAGLENELEQLQPLLERYEKEGRPYALAAATSHLRQRFAARGDVKQELYRTRAMKEYRTEAQNFANRTEFDREEVTW